MTTKLKLIASALLVAVLAAFAGACGGGGESPDATVQTFFEAVVDGDGDTACDLISEDGQSVISDSLGADSADCADGVEQVSQLAEATGIEIASTETVSEEGDSATVEVTLEVMGQEDVQEVELTNEDGWKITGSE